MTSPNHVVLEKVTKRFGGVLALSEVSLEIAQGSIHALVGENGAGKSTLGRLIAGAHAPDEGQLIVNGRAVHYRSPRNALRDGLTIVAQELALVPQLTVIDNVFLGVEPVAHGVLNTSTMRRRYANFVKRTGFNLRPDTRVDHLGVADQQRVEILHALARDAQLIVMDEPTAALAADDAAQLLQVIRELARGGTTIVYVSHFLGEVLQLADVVTVLRDGRVVRTAPCGVETETSLITAMLGRSLASTFPAKSPRSGTSTPVLEVSRLSRPPRVSEVSLTVAAGEIVGVAGLVGSGRTELARAIFGADRYTAGSVSVNGLLVPSGSPRAAKRAGIAMLPESRKDEGLVMARPLRENLSLAHLGSVTRNGVIRRRTESSKIAALIDDLSIRPPVQSAPVSTLSGGNQQKTLFGKWLFTPPAVLLADEPTRGVDVGAKSSIYELLTSLAARGMGILFISSELEEVIGLAHRVLVMRTGRIVAEFAHTDLNEETLMQAAFGADAPGEKT